MRAAGGHADASPQIPLFVAGAEHVAGPCPDRDLILRPSSGVEPERVGALRVGGGDEAA